MTAARVCKIDECDRYVQSLGLCSKHYYRLRRHGDPNVVLRPIDPAIRFWRLVDKAGPSDCWEWTGCKHKGYGQFQQSKGRGQRAHRFAYELLVGPIPDGLVIDHLCRNRSCVNPAHLEPVTSAVNTARSQVATATRNRMKTHCKYGHEFTPENTYTRKGIGRSCRECQRIKGRSEKAKAQQRARYQRRKKAA